MAQPLAEVSGQTDARARKTQSLITRRAQSTTYRRMSALLEIDESTLTRWRDDHLKRAVEYILATSCKIVPNELVCHDPKYIDTMEYLADIGMRHARAETRQLEWDE